MIPEEEKSNRLDELEKRLYSADSRRMPKRRIGVLHPVQHMVSGEWKSAASAASKTVADTFTTRAPLFKMFFICSLIFFAGALIFGAYKFFGNTSSVSVDNVNIDVLGNTFAAGGEALPLQIEVGNQNAVSLEYADLIIEYPRGSAAGNTGSDMVRQHVLLGTIKPGAVAHERISVTLYGEQGSTKDIKLSLQFRVAGSNAVFQKVRTYSVAINSAPAVLAVEAPKSISPNQQLELVIHITPNANKSISNLVVKVDYPTGFQFKQADPAPAYLSNVWQLGDLEPGTPADIKIKGIVLGENGEERSFRIYAGIADGKDTNSIGVILASAVHTVSIERPFLEAKLAINGITDKDTIVTSSHATTNVEVRWANNLSSRILNAQVQAKLSGDLLDKSSVSPEGGFYNSTDNTITWDKNTTPEFASINPGQFGALGFSFKSFSLVKPDHTLYDNPVITIELSIKGQQTAENGGTQEVNSFEKKTIRFSTDFQITAEVFRLIGPFTNSGPLPPKADNKTTYTVRWSLTTSANPIENVVVRTSMPSYVHFLGNISPTSEDLGLDPITGEIVWKVTSLPKGTGLITDPRAVYFQIELAPSLTQVGSVPTLINETRAEGHDSYTNADLASKWKSLDTNIHNDPASVPGVERVVK